jgi:hypothetical protein
VLKLDEAEVLAHLGGSRLLGLYAQEPRFQRRRASRLICGGVGADAAFLAHRIVGRTT